MAWLRVAGALASILVVSTELGSVTHFATVRHAVCAEHGELVHAAGFPSAALGREPSHGRLNRGAAPGQAHEHDHCLSAARGSDPGVTRPSSERLDVAEVASVRQRITPSTARLTAARLYRIAPKTSPPLAGSA